MYDYKKCISKIPKFLFRPYTETSALRLNSFSLQDVLMERNLLISKPLGYLQWFVLFVINFGHISGCIKSVCSAASRSPAAELAVWASNRHKHFPHTSPISILNFGTQRNRTEGFMTNPSEKLSTYLLLHIREAENLNSRPGTTLTCYPPILGRYPSVATRLTQVSPVRAINSSL